MAEEPNEYYIVMHEDELMREVGVMCASWGSSLALCLCSSLQHYDVVVFNVEKTNTLSPATHSF